MTQDGRMLSTKQEEDFVCACVCMCVGVGPMCRRRGCGYRGWGGKKRKTPDCYCWVHVKDIKAALLNSETVARCARPSKLLYLLDSSH